MNIFKHQLGFELPRVPYLWDYAEMDIVYPAARAVKKVTYNDLKKLIDEYIKFPLYLSDDDTDFYINVQKKNISSSSTDTIYLAYHTWLLDHDTIDMDISMTTRKKYLFKTSIYPIDGTIGYSCGYPRQGTYHKNKPGGIEINRYPSNRVASIHPIDDIIRFSSINVCNMNVLSDCAVFLSVLLDASYMNKQKLPGKRNCITLHIFNKNSTIDKNFDIMIDKYYNKYSTN